MCLNALILVPPFAYIIRDTAMAFGWNIGNRKTVVIMEYLWLLPVQKKKIKNQSIALHSCTFKFHQAEFVDIWYELVVRDTTPFKASVRAIFLLFKTKLSKHQLFEGEKMESMNLFEFLDK